MRLQALIRRFENAQHKYARAGAASTEASTTFQLIVMNATIGMSPPTSIDWRLHLSPEDETAPHELTRITRDVAYYVSHGLSPAEQIYLKEYCNLVRW